MSKGKKRPFSVVKPVGDYLIDSLSPYCERIELAGSLRRECKEIGDIEIVALPHRVKDLFGSPVTNQPTELDVFLNDRRVEFIKNGNLYKQFKYGSYKVDLFLPASLAHWGSNFLIRTGSSQFSVWCVDTRAKEVGVYFSRGLVYRGQNLIDTSEEAQVFEALELPWIEPKNRSGSKWKEVVG